MLSCIILQKWITNAVWAEYFTTAVRTAGKPGDAYGISVLLVQRTEGVSTRKMMMGGSWCAGTSYLTFDDVKVPVGNLLGKEVDDVDSSSPLTTIFAECALTITERRF